MRIRYEIILTVEADGRMGPAVVRGMVQNALKRLQMQMSAPRIAASYVVHEEESH